MLSPEQIKEMRRPSAMTFPADASDEFVQHVCQMDRNLNFALDEVERLTAENKKLHRNWKGALTNNRKLGHDHDRLMMAERAEMERLYNIIDSERSTADAHAANAKRFSNYLDEVEADVLANADDRWEGEPIKYVRHLEYEVERLQALNKSLKTVVDGAVEAATRMAEAYEQKETNNEGL